MVIKVSISTLIVSLVVNLVLFVIAFWRRSDKLTDISYALSFVMIAITGMLNLGSSNAYSWILFALVVLWAGRLGSFLLIRVLTVGKDQRFDGIRENFTKFGRFWLGQACTAWLLMLPVTFAQVAGGSLTIVASLGIIIWSVGLVIESFADFQKFAFKQNPANKGKWIDSGVWKYARHPNYFGEMLVWVGLYVYSFSVLNGVERLIGLVSPLLIIVLLRFISGVPPLEKSADNRWGGQPGYQAYKHRTRLLVPLARRR